MASQNFDEELKTCSNCKVKMNSEGMVFFSCGNPGSRARLYARVCQFAADKENCINKGFKGKIKKTDEWQEDIFRS